MSPVEMQRTKVAEARKRYLAEIELLQSLEGAQRWSPVSAVATLPKDPCCSKAVQAACTCGEAILCEDHGRQCRGEFSHD